jgi:membrane-associated protease RseP (regulator of RpoE activity)
VSEPRAAGRYALIAALIAAAGVVIWLALAVYNRPAVGDAAAPNPAPAPVKASAAIRPTPAIATPPPASTVAARATGQVADTIQQDERQVAKITRGLTANPGGGILVEAVPDGSVASQLRVEAGDVIVSVNGATVTSPEEFARIYREEGLPRQMTVIHDGREMHHH